MIVRLKEGLLQMDNRIRLSFQFYDSPIKRQQRLLRYTEIIQFQFYDSPIKRVTCSKSSKYYMNFNSMIVRLKASTRMVLYSRL